MLKCEVEGCEKPHVARGMCRMHYARKGRTGTTELRSALSTEERFWKYVLKTKTCWLWQSAIVRGYGILRVGGKNVRAHRISYELHDGPIPEGMMVLHTCDNRRCVNPQHLYVGTHQENMQDRSDHDRCSRASAVITQEQADKIYIDRRPSRTVAKEYGISKSTVNRILRGETYAHRRG